MESPTTMSSTGATIHIPMIPMRELAYDLKESSIAIYPASPRGSSKLLRVKDDGTISHFANFSESIVSLAQGCHVVFNESRVLDARVFVRTEDGTTIEMMILDLGDVDIKAPCKDTLLTVMLRKENVQAGDVLDDTVGGKQNIKVEQIKGIWQEDVKSDGNGTKCEVRILQDMSIEDYLRVAGTVPIPPYFHRPAEPRDEESYNNVYAAQGGSVAAPTAGLHFTTQLIKELNSACSCSFLSLHVGAGTFQPVISHDARNHEMHAETFSVSVQELKQIIVAMEQGKPIMAVGTTSSRTLESLYWCGVKKIREGVNATSTSESNRCELGQFEWVHLLQMNKNNDDATSISPAAAFSSLVNGLNDTDIVSGKTSLMIVPGHYEFQVVQHLVTNFHAPDSTLMLLVSAFLESIDKIKSVYAEAQRMDYKFLSYGDVCLFTRPKK